MGRYLRFRLHANKGRLEIQDNDAITTTSWVQYIYWGYALHISTFLFRGAHRNQHYTDQHATHQLEILTKHALH